MRKEVINPPGIHAATTYYSHAIKCGNTIYCAGQTALDEQGNVVGDDIETQATKVFENIGAVLQAAGASFSDVVNVTTFLLNLERDRKTYMEVRRRFMGEWYPASIICGVRELANPRYLVEVAVIAVTAS